MTAVAAASVRSRAGGLEFVPALLAWRTTLPAGAL